SAANVSIWLPRIFTSANSAVTKKPFKNTSPMTAANLPISTRGGSQCRAIMSAVGIATRKENEGKFIIRMQTLHPKPKVAENLPARLGYARDQPLRGELTKSETRYLEGQAQ